MLTGVLAVDGSLNINPQANRQNGLSGTGSLLRARHQASAFVRAWSSSLHLRASRILFALFEKTARPALSKYGPMALATASDTSMIRPPSSPEMMEDRQRQRQRYAWPPYHRSCRFIQPGTPWLFTYFGRPGIFDTYKNNLATLHRRPRLTCTPTFRSMRCRLASRGSTTTQADRSVLFSESWGCGSDLLQRNDLLLHVVSDGESLPLQQQGSGADRQRAANSAGVS